ncbi:MAG: PaaI family thioesterase [Dehalococcoidia bacterium]|nr:PaaI family thioesterase [Chloroflexota bacterium]MXW25520.1 PaaI family thioesterase [Dehalococcoidia bacterium]MXZ87647.1 PaaI family thioesterase [Dehalococcoidia bacterium]MYA53584.1 PaaI family thioesterase [Dehalococcoidia bacterium]MYH68034.1 PaaI family thioesterase [Dehalococcoidia bacterium]
MARRRLTRDDLAVETCCFVCDPANEDGLHIEFFLDEEAGRVLAEYTPTSAHEGAPGVIHGGVVGAILDDAMAWAVNVLSGSFGLTRRGEIEYSRIVRPGEPYTVTAWISEIGQHRAATVAELHDAEEHLCCATKAEFSLISHEEARLAFERRTAAGGE